MVRKVVLLLLVAGLVVVVNERLRNRLLDLLFGAEEEFAYTPTTSGSPPPD